MMRTTKVAFLNSYVKNGDGSYYERMQCKNRHGIVKCEVLNPSALDGPGKEGG